MDRSRRRKRRGVPSVGLNSSTGTPRRFTSRGADEDDYASTLSLASAAIRTGFNFSNSENYQNLRHRHVSFISAGFLGDPDDEINQQQQEEEDILVVSTEEYEVKAKLASLDESIPPPDSVPPSHENTISGNLVSIELRLKNSLVLQSTASTKGEDTSQIRRPSPTSEHQNLLSKKDSPLPPGGKGNSSSVSSGDEVVFAGKDPTAQSMNMNKNHPWNWNDDSTEWVSRSKPVETAETAETAETSVPSVPISDEDEETQMLQDYIENLREQGELEDLAFSRASFAQRELSLMDGTEILLISETAEEVALSRSGVEAEDEYEADNANDADDDNDSSLSTSSDGDELDTDTMLARALGGKEPFNLISGNESDDEDSDDDIDDDGYDNNALNTSRQTKLAVFPSGSLMNDVHQPAPYNGFDIMDFDRPSLHVQRKKGKKNGPPEVSDPELAEILQTTWEKDRQKKKANKQKRAELRAKGLLQKGSKGKSRLDEKYEQGMKLSELKFELFDFLASDKQRLSLPPMDKHARKMIHELAHSLGLQSKSAGNGKSRHTALTKTRRTTFEDGDFARVERKIRRGFFPRTDTASGKARVIPSGGAPNHQAVRYREGEIVGAAAPEIAEGNRGRSMLEKMGWSSGTALGSMNNKGILEPIEHIVKNSRAGLG